MARVNLTLDSDTYGKLSQVAKAMGAKRAAAARLLLREALSRREQRERRAKLAADYSAGRADAEEILADYEAPQLELMDDDDA